MQKPIVINYNFTIWNAVDVTQYCMLDAINEQCPVRGGICYGGSQLDTRYLGSGDGTNRSGTIMIECEEHNVNIKKCINYCRWYNTGSKRCGCGSGGTIHLISLATEHNQDHIHLHLGIITILVKCTSLYSFNSLHSLNGMNGTNVMNGINVMDVRHMHNQHSQTSLHGLNTIWALHRQRSHGSCIKQR